MNDFAFTVTMGNAATIRVYPSLLRYWAGELEADPDYEAVVCDDDGQFVIVKGL